jgi:hypothetical protein
MWSVVSRALILGLASVASADTVITREGRELFRAVPGCKEGTIPFTDTSGIGYTFPLPDVQSLVFTSANDTVTLRNGKLYSGKFTGADPLAFKDNLGIRYEFPRKDVESLVLSTAGLAQALAPPQGVKVIPMGSEIRIRTNENIDSDSVQPGQLFSAEVTESVPDLAGGVAIPGHAPAQLLILSGTGGAVGSPNLALDLDAVTINGRVRRVYTSELKESNDKGFGKNKRTAEFLGGGAAIGAASGAGGGFLTQLFTRGKQVKVPAETVLHFRLERPLVLQPQ